MSDREKLIDIVEDYADYLDWDTKYAIVDSIMELLATDNNVGDKWIPVSERLPENSKDVLVWGSGYAVHIAWYVPTFNEWRTNEYDYDDGEVTHWMPLPEPPKECE